MITKIHNAYTGQTIDCLDTDSSEYDILMDAVTSTINVPGISCEIGIRRGGASSIIMLCYALNRSKRLHIGIDPYGNIDYDSGDNIKSKHDYTNTMKILALAEIHQWCAKYNLEFQLFNMEDTEFFKRFSDGVPVYNETKSIVNQYRLVFFDGPHATEPILKEVEFFKDRTHQDGMWVFDDYRAYDHDRVDALIKGWGMCEVKRGLCKISYRKT